MINVYNVTTALKTIIQGVSGVGGVRIGEGDMNKLDTIAVEIVPKFTDLAQNNLGQGATTDITYIDIYMASKANEQDPQDHEQRLHTVVKAFIDTISARAFDKTLSGNCEFLIPTQTAYDYMRDDNRLYFAAVIRLEAHDERTP